MVDLVFDVAFAAGTVLSFVALALFVRGCERM